MPLDTPYNAIYDDGFTIYYLKQRYWMDLLLREGLDREIHFLPIFLYCVWRCLVRKYRQQCKGIRLSHNRPILSHLCFLDDLLLFGEATEAQACTMERVL